MKRPVAIVAGLVALAGGVAWWLLRSKAAGQSPGEAVAGLFKPSGPAISIGDITNATTIAPTIIQAAEPKADAKASAWTKTGSTYRGLVQWWNSVTGERVDLPFGQVP